MAVHRFPPYQPDVCQLDAGVTDHTCGVLPGADCLLPMPQLQVTGNAVSGGPVRGSAWARRTNGTSQITVAGTTTHLWTGSGGSWYDAQGQTYNLPSGGYWQFRLFGNTLVAANGADTLQKADIDTIGVSLSASAQITTRFSDLNTSHSASLDFRYIETVGDFLVAGWESSNFNRVKWSGLNLITGDGSWTPGTNSSGEQDIPDGGRVTGITGGRVSGHVYLERAIWRMTYTQGEEVFRFDQIEKDIGSTYPYALTSLWGVDYFLNSRGFIRLNRDETLTPIGFGKINKFFQGDVNPSKLPETFAFNDPRNHLIWFVYWSIGNDTSYADSALVFNILSEEWRLIEGLNISSFLASVEASYAVDNTSPNISEAPYSVTDMDTDLVDSAGNPISPDSPVFTGQEILFGAYNNEDKLGQYTGAPMAAEMETGAFQLNPSGRAFVRGVYPVIHGTNSVKVSVATRELPGDAWSFGSDVAAESTTGWSPQRRSGRFHKARVKIPAGTTWEKAHGVLTPEFEPDGMR